jgi:hypothetical protein
MRTMEKNTMMNRRKRKRGKPYDRTTLVLGLSFLLAPYLHGKVNKKRRLVKKPLTLMALSKWNNHLKSLFTTIHTMP